MLIYLSFLSQIYDTANGVFSDRRHFDKTSRAGPKVGYFTCLMSRNGFSLCVSFELYKFYTFQVFVSEYAVWRDDAGKGSLLASLAEAGFLLGIEKNRFRLYSFCLVIGFDQLENALVFTISFLFLLTQ